MTPEQLHYTRVIAEFMGDLVIYDRREQLDAVPTKDLKPWCYSWQAKYHLKYDDWLMPVWVKFRDIRIPDHFTDSEIGHLDFLYSEIRFAMTDEDIEDAFLLVGKAIEWYNLQKL